MTSTSPDPQKPSTTLIWDLPIRCFHWGSVIAFGFCWWSAENGQMDWHVRSGYGLLVLLLFRLIWGFVGSETARFRQFLRGPKAVFAAIKKLKDRSPSHSIGHNPLGGWSVMLMLSLLTMQIGLGLFAEDIDGLASGPFTYLLSYDQARWAAETHETLFNLVLAVVMFHIAAVVYYFLYKKENLILPMLNGQSQTLKPPSPLHQGSLLSAFIIVISLSLFVYFIV